MSRLYLFGLVVRNLRCRHQPRLQRVEAAWREARGTCSAEPGHIHSVPSPSTNQLFIAFCCSHPLQGRGVSKQRSSSHHSMRIPARDQTAYQDPEQEYTFFHGKTCRAKSLVVPTPRLAVKANGMPRPKHARDRPLQAITMDSAQGLQRRPLIEGSSVDFVWTCVPVCHVPVKATFFNQKSHCQW
jgi:hypothetical protein